MRSRPSPPPYRDPVPPNPTRLHGRSGNGDLFFVSIVLLVGVVVFVTLATIEVRYANRVRSLETEVMVLEGKVMALEEENTEILGAINSTLFLDDLVDGVQAH